MDVRALLVRVCMQSAVKMPSPVAIHGYDLINGMHNAKIYTLGSAGITR